MTPTWLPVIPENIPETLQKSPRWVGWIPEQRSDGSWTKKPCLPDGTVIDATKTYNWSPLGRALPAYQSSAGAQGGVGFAMQHTPGRCLTGIDFDQDDEQTRAWIATLDTYTERSPSGRGFRLFAFTDLKEYTNEKKPRGEVSNGKKYFTVTGHHVSGTPLTVNERTSEVKTLIEYLQGAPTLETPSAAAPVTPVTPAASPQEESRWRLTEDDEAILTKARDAQNGEKFIALYDKGDFTGYPSQSEADLALCALLAYWTNGNRERIDRLFRGSALMRTKWDERHGTQTYGQQSITEALKGWEALSEYEQATAPTVTAPVEPKNQAQSQRITVDSGVARFVIRRMAEMKLDTLKDRLQEIHTLQGEISSSPWSPETLDLMLAVATAQPIADESETFQPWVLVVSPPSNDKTGTVLTADGVPSVLFVDDLTENSFLSGYVPPKGEDRKPDLLTLINDKGILMLGIKDLTTLFSGREERVRKVLGDLQSASDGKLTKATGTRGLLECKSKFTIIGCITPAALYLRQTYMAVMGARFLFLDVPTLSRQERKQGLGKGRQTADRQELLGLIRRLVAQQIAETLWTRPGTTTPMIPAPSLSDAHHEQLETMGTFLAAARSVFTYGHDETDEGKAYKYRLPDQTEEPFRVVQQLRTLTRSVARVRGHQAVEQTDIDLVKRCVLSTVPVSRRGVLRLFATRETVTAADCEREKLFTAEHARNMLPSLARVGVLVGAQAKGHISPYRIAPEYQSVVCDPDAWTGVGDGDNHLDR